MSGPLAVLRDVTVTDGAGRAVLAEVDLEVSAGERVAVVGRSGSGKTTVALAMLGHLRPGLSLACGRAELGGATVLPGPGPSRERRRRLAQYVPQDPAAALTPTMRVGALLAEACDPPSGRPSGGWRRRDPAGAELLRELGLPADREFARRYPHQLSGGQRRRLALALALAPAPELLLLDEPTANLDATARRRLLELVDAVARRRSTAMVVVSHDLAAVRMLTGRAVEMAGGRIGPAPPTPRASLPPVARLCADPPAAAEPGAALLSVVGLRAGYGGGRRRRTVLDGVELSLGAGRSLGIIGPSGCGKSTLARCIAGLHRPDAGAVALGGVPLAARAARRSRTDRRRIALVFQDPVTALNPRRTVGAQLAGPLSARGVGRARLGAEVAQLLATVELGAGLAARTPAELSGGERQRVAIARALAGAPEVLVCDEVTSALDGATATAICALLARVNRDAGIALLVIAHDPTVIAALTDSVAVLDEGRIVEAGATARLTGRGGVLEPLVADR